MEMDTPTAKALRASVQDRLSMGEPVAVEMYERAWVIGLSVFAVCAALTIAAVYVKHKKDGCVGCGD